MRLERAPLGLGFAGLYMPCQGVEIVILRAENVPFGMRDPY